MSDTTPIIDLDSRRRMLLVLAWAVTLSISLLPNVLWGELTGQPTAWMFWAKMALLVALIGLSLFWRAIAPLRPFLVIAAAIYAFEWLAAWVGGTAPWQRWFGGTGISFARSMMGTQLLRLAVALAVVGLLWILKRRRGQTGSPRAAFFLVKGRLDAPARRVRWLGIDEGTPWNKLGLALSLIISLGTLVFLLIAGLPSLTALGRALPLLPVVLLFAAMNAFSEEMSYRAALLTPLEPIAGGAQSLLITAFFFGMGHYYGVPYGIVGVVMAGFLGWLLGKSMLETRGMGWAWFIHLLQDVLIFTFMAIGSVTPGGG